MNGQLDVDPIARLREEPIQNISNKLYEKIRAMILSGELAAGYLFPNENVLCEQLSVGRSSLREAYKALNMAGFITRSKKGTCVNDMETIANATPFSITVENSSLSDLFEFRFMLEAETARYAATRATEREVGALRTIIELEKENYTNVEQLTRLDTQFHMNIAKASHNELLMQAMSAASGTFEKGIRKAFEKAVRHNEAVEETIEQHEALLQAISQKDAINARDLMRSHISYIQKL